MVVLRAENLRVEPQRLKIDSLVLEAPELVVLLGPNGAGKSSFLEAVVGVLEFKGCLEKQPGLWGYVPQKYDFPFRMAVKDLVVIGRYPLHRGLPSKLDFTEAESALDQVGISHLAERCTTTLSGGEAQKVQVARALAADPVGLVLDEPCSQLDPLASMELMDTLRLLSRGPKARPVLLSCHDLSLVSCYAQRIMGIQAGQLRWCLAAPEVGQAEITGLFGELIGQLWHRMHAGASPQG